MCNKRIVKQKGTFFFLILFFCSCVFDVACKADQNSIRVYEAGAFYYLGSWEDPDPDEYISDESFSLNLNPAEYRFEKQYRALNPEGLFSSIYLTTVQNATPEEMYASILYYGGDATEMQMLEIENLHVYAFSILGKDEEDGEARTLVLYMQASRQCLVMLAFSTFTVSEEKVPSAEEMLSFLEENHLLSNLTLIAP